MKKPWVLSYPLSAQRRLIRLGRCPDLSLRWVHTHFIGFVMSWVMCACLCLKLELGFSPVCIQMKAGRLAQMVKAFAKIMCCKSLSLRYEFDSSQGQFVCLDMFVNGLAIICLSGWFHSSSCLSRGRTHVLASLHLNSPRRCCI